MRMDFEETGEAKQFKIPHCAEHGDGKYGTYCKQCEYGYRTFFGRVCHKAPMKGYEGREP